MILADVAPADGATPSPRQRNLLPLAVLAALGPMAVVLAATAVVLLARESLLTGADIVRLVLAVAFAVAGLTLIHQPATRHAGMATLAAVLVAALEFLATAQLRLDPGSGLPQAVEALAAPLVVAVAFHLLLLLGADHVRRSMRPLLLAAYAAAVGIGLLRWMQGAEPALWPVVALGLVLGAVGLVVSHQAYLAARGAARQRMQWLGLALALWVEISVIAGAMHILVDWPRHIGETIGAGLVLVAAALVAGASSKVVGWVDRLLSHAVSVAGASALVTVIYLVVVVGLGRVPTEGEQTVLVLSMAAAAISALAYVPTRAALSEMSNRLVYGQERDPSEALDTFGARLTRALPMDELLLQLAELCKKHLALSAAEVWTGVEGHLAVAAAVPDRRGRLDLGPEELPVVSRSRACGRGWAEVWLPGLLDSRGVGPLRIVPMTHSGELFGLLVLERPADEDDFSEEDDRVLSELARQVALALHNSELDNALQQTLAEIQRKNVELQESRARIVATADRERRAIERNLHDGAQQHLVALAVKLRLIQRLGETDPARAFAMIEEARNDALATVDELRALAHGIYPPLLMDQGLGTALSAAAGRAPLPTTVHAIAVGRYPQDVEAAVYFCCLEALQNAGKHAGEGASAEIVLEQTEGCLRFSVTDNGAGFDPSEGRRGYGFVNMEDRLGAIGGTIAVTSAPGAGTTITATLPAVPLDAR